MLANADYDPKEYRYLLRIMLQGAPLQAYSASARYRDWTMAQRADTEESNCYYNKSQCTSNLTLSKTNKTSAFVD
jgi:hypothetical protein